MSLNTANDFLGFPAKTLAALGIYHSATLAGNLTMDASYPNILKLDPGGAARDVTLPTAADDYNGVVYLFVNAADAAENLVIKSAASTVVTINQNEAALVVCENAVWTLVCVATIALS